MGRPPSNRQQKYQRRNTSILLERYLYLSVVPILFTLVIIQRSLQPYGYTDRIRDVDMFEHTAEELTTRTRGKTSQSYRDVSQSTNGNNSHNITSDKKKVMSSCLDPNGPQPVILMSLGRSGSSSTWQILGALTGQETKSVEYTGSSRDQSIAFFEKIGANDGGKWILKYLCQAQKPYPHAGIVGFKWKPNWSIQMEASVNGLKLLGKMKSIKVVRSRRNLLDVLLSRYKHKRTLRSNEHVPAHCIVGDKACLEKQLKAGKGVELPDHKIVELLKTLTAEENEVDKQLKEFGVPSVHASFEKLYYNNDPNEWKRIMHFVAGPVSARHLTIAKVRSSMKHASTTHPSHNVTISNYEEIVKLLRGTEFEKLLRQ